MDRALVGLLVVFGILHLLLIAVPVGAALRAPISSISKAFWCAFLVTLPFIGVAIFHFRYRSSLFMGKPYDPGPHDLGIRNWRDSPDDRD